MHYYGTHALTAAAAANSRLLQQQVLCLSLSLLYGAGAAGLGCRGVCSSGGSSLGDSKPPTLSRLNVLANAFCCCPCP